MIDQTITPFEPRMWTEALRSGKYKQGRNVLHSSESESFCCLGVLCDLAIKAGVPVSVAQRNRVTFYDGKDLDLPESVIQWAEVTDCNPSLSLRNSTLAGLNDSGYSFGEIADIIEEDSKSIFVQHIEQEVPEEGESINDFLVRREQMS